MNGLRYDSASFPPNKNYSIVHKMVGMHSVDTIDDWADSEDIENEVAVRQAYWATRCNNNCQVLNRTLLHEIQHSGKDMLLVKFGCLEAIATSSLELKIMGLTPKIQGRIVEPPIISNVPASPDGETYHLFISGFTKSKEKVYGLDCSCAQFGVFSSDGDDEKPFLASELKFFLKRLGKHRLLKPEEQSVDEVDSFVQHKIDACLKVMRRLDKKN